MKYKGYIAHVVFDEEAGILFGEVLGLRDTVTFETADVKDLQNAFQESVDDYLAMCKDRKEKPQKSYSGKLLLRIDPQLHRDLANAATLYGQSLNAFIADLLPRIALPAHQMVIYQAHCGQQTASAP